MAGSSLIFRLCLPVALALLAGGGAWAQALNLASADENAPIEIFADDGIEWQQDNEILIARGNARAVRQGNQVDAQELRAYYKKNAEGGTNLSRLDATGDVRISTPTQSIRGQRAVYDLVKAVLVVTGRNVVFTSGPDRITADKQMEYWEGRLMAVARGNAVAVHDGKTVRAETLVAKMRKTAQGKTEVVEVQAFDNVIIETEQDVVRANKGIYNVESGIATLVGGVEITRGPNRLNGSRAEINVNTGISRLLTEPGVKSRVRGVILPNSQTKNK